MRYCKLICLFYRCVGPIFNVEGNLFGWISQKSCFAGHALRATVVYDHPSSGEACSKRIWVLHAFGPFCAKTDLGCEFFRAIWRHHPPPSNVLFVVGLVSIIMHASTGQLECWGFPIKNPPHMSVSMCQKLEV